MEEYRGLKELLRERRRKDFADESPGFPEYPEEYSDETVANEALKHRRAALTRQMLNDSGYDEYARSIPLKER